MAKDGNVESKEDYMASILIIDDDPDIVKMLRIELKEMGHNVNSAGTAEEAIEKIRANPPDLITLDIHMPGNGGLAVANELDSSKLQIPYILCTATDINDPIKAFELFVVKHLYAGTLKKPMKNSEIKAAVNKALELSKQLKDK